jgi:histidinol-phosphate/aromatic aminotransferase/cobyric acid decarboxylase-like protein
MPFFPASQRYSLPYRAIEMRRVRQAKLAAQQRTSEAGFGAQGGDPRRGVDMDLSTCVNRYGPAPAAVEALHSIPPADILLHPYDAAERLVEVYRWAPGVNGGAMIAGRGASEFIWAMGRIVAPRSDERERFLGAVADVAAALAASGEAEPAQRA